MKKTLAVLLLVVLIVASMPITALADSASKVYRVNTKSDPLMVHSKPNGDKSSRIGYLSKNSALIVLDKSGSWWKIKAMKGLVGWVSSNYLKEGADARVNTKETGLNIHKTRDFNPSSVIGSAPKGAQVTVMYIQGSYANIIYHKLKGWSSRNYLKWIA